MADTKSNDNNAFLLHGDPAITTFSMLEKSFVDLRPIIKKAKAYARSDSPMLIESSAGPELEMLAQAIHNGSVRKQGPFIIVIVSGMTTEEQDNILFGNPKIGTRGALLDANHGTIMIQSIDKLTMSVQSKLARVIRSKRISNNLDLSKYKYIDIRIIATTSKNLNKLRKDYMFRSDLLFVLKALRVRIPKLKERKKDIQNMLDFYIADFNTQYHTKHELSDSARAKILNYSWEGNIAQLQAFCERMILTANERMISSRYVEELIQELYIEDSGIFDDPEVLAGETAKASNRVSSANAPGSPASGTAFAAGSIPGDPLEFADYYRNLLITTLRKNNGSRKRTAEELKMSPTTLWRKMQQYNIDE